MKRFARLAPAVVLILLTLLSPLFAPWPTDRPVVAPYAQPSGQALLGGDQLGRDVLSRLLAGGVQPLLVATVIAVLVTALAAVLGAVAALRPRLGRFIERTADMLVLLPVVLAMLLVVLSWPSGGTLALIVAAVVVGLPYAVRVVAGAAAPIAASGYVEVAAAGGEHLGHLVWREVLPNLRSTLVTLLGLRFVAAVYVVTTAGFLEIGPQPPEANWALMIRENSAGIQLNPLAVIAPSLAIGVLAIAVTVATNALAPKEIRR